MADSTLHAGFPASQNGPRSSLERVRQAIDSLGLAVRDARADSFMACCPVHGDKTPSLHVSWTRGHSSGAVLLHCHAGCDTAVIVDALGLAWADLFDDPLPERDRALDRVGKSLAQRRAGKRRGKLGRLPALITTEPAPHQDENVDHQWVEVDRYPYVDHYGRLVQEVIRQECTAEGTRHKNFPQHWFTTDGRCVKTKPRGFKPVLYRAPEVARAVRDGVEIWVLEGEKDVATAEGLGLVATTNTQGGKSFPDELVDELAGARVSVVLDRDATGWARGVDLHSKLAAVDATVRLLLPDVNEPKADFTDHVRAGHGVEDFIEVNVDLVRIWHTLESELAKARAKAKTVHQAVREARARWELAEAGTDVEESTRFAQRWALESQVRHEALAEIVGKVQAAAIRAGTDWAAAAVEEAARLLSEAGDAARRCHHTVGVAVPVSLLQAREHEGDTDVAAAQTAESSSSPASPTAVATSSTSSIKGGLGARADAPVFRVVDGKIYQWEPERSRRAQDDEDVDQPGKLKQLLSMVVRVVAREYLESEDRSDAEGAELLGRSTPGRKKASAPRRLTAVRLQYVDPISDELMEIRVGADQWRDHSWLESLPGPPDYDHKRAGLDTLQRAILAISDGVVDEELYRSTGWRRGPDGSHRYVHARGAITAEGHADVEVSLSGPIGRFDLPDPVRDPDTLRKAWLDCSATMLDRFPGRVAAPLLGHVFRAPLGSSPWNVALIGSPGSYKTSLAAKAMHHFGERWDHTTPISSMSGNGATFNALRLTLNKAKDALAWLDDFAPTKSWLDAQKLLEETSRLIHNREERPRSSRDGQEVMPGTAPRTSGLFTSEVMPRPGSSGGERMLVIPMQRDEIALADLMELDRAESRHGRALVMSSFISWLARDLEAKRGRYLEIASNYADLLAREEGETVRQAAAISHTWIGWVSVLDFLLDAGGVTEEERTATLRRVDEHLREAGRAAVDPDIPRTTGARVRDLLGYALRQGIAYVDDVRTGDMPPWPLASRLGWRRTCLTEPTDDLPAKYRLDRGGIRLGYVLHDPGPKERRGKVLMCVPAQIEAVLKAAGSTQVEKLEIDWKTAARALYDEGTLLGDSSSEAGRVRLTLKCRIFAEGTDARMAVLRLEQIIGEDPGDFGDDFDDDAPDGDQDPADGSLPSPNGGHQLELPGLDLAPHSLDAAPAPVEAHTSTTEVAALQAPQDEPNDDRTHGESQMSATQPDLRPVPNGVPAVCVECDYPTMTMIGDAPMHRSCWSQLAIESGVIESSHLDVVETSTPPADDQAPTHPQAQAVVTEPQPAPPVASPAAPRPHRKPNTKETAEFTAAAAVVDVDGIWLSNGEFQELPPGGPDHVGQLLLLAQHLNLGTQATKYVTDGGQIWIGSALAARMGIDVETIAAAEEEKRDTVAHEVTKDSPAVTTALERGYQLGGKGESLGRWTRIWKGQQKSVWLVLMPALTRDDDRMALVRDDPDHATLARRIGQLADKLGYPFHLSPASTGLDLLKAVRRKDRETFFQVIEPIEPASRSTLEVDINWSRKPTEDELQHEWVHAYDRSGSYLAGVAGLELGVGEPEHHDQGVAFDAKTPGYWRVEIPESGDWRVPNPLDPRGRNAGRTLWVTTPSLQFALEEEYAPEILEAWTWPEHARVLDPWYERVRDARTALDIDDPDAQVARDQLKQVYAHTIGMFGSTAHRQGKDDFRPDWRHLIVAKARTNILRRVATIGKATGRWPVAIVTDTVLYTSNEPDPVKAWPGGDKTLGRQLGRYKPEGTARLAEHLKYLTGTGYKGRDSIVEHRAGAE